MDMVFQYTTPNFCIRQYTVPSVDKISCIYNYYFPYLAPELLVWQLEEPVQVSADVLQSLCPLTYQALVTTVHRRGNICHKPTPAAPTRVLEIATELFFTKHVTAIGYSHKEGIITINLNY